MKDLLFIVIVCGGGMLWILSRTEIGHAIADRIRGETTGRKADPALLEEVERLRTEVADLQERMEFAERLLSANREPGRLGP